MILCLEEVSLPHSELNSLATSREIYKSKSNKSSGFLHLLRTAASNSFSVPLLASNFAGASDFSFFRRIIADFDVISRVSSSSWFAVESDIFLPVLTYSLKILSMIICNESSVLLILIRALFCTYLAFKAFWHLSKARLTFFTYLI